MPDNNYWFKKKNLLPHGLLILNKKKFMLKGLLKKNNKKAGSYLHNSTGPFLTERMRRAHGKALLYVKIITVKT